MTDYDEIEKTVTLTQRNRFFKGDEVEILMPGRPFITVTVENMTDENGEEIEVANHAQMTVKFKCEEKIVPGAMIRKAR